VTNNWIDVTYKARRKHARDTWRLRGEAQQACIRAGISRFTVAQRFGFPATNFRWYMLTEEQCRILLAEYR